MKEKLIKAYKSKIATWVDCVDADLSEKENLEAIQEIEETLAKLKTLVSEI